MYGSLFYEAFFVSHEVTFSINKLPEANVNQPYLQKIEIYNAGAMPDEDQIQWEVTPENTGLTIKRTISETSRNGFFGGIEISGIPKFQGEITINIHGYGYSSYSGRKFNKTFHIKVNP